MKIDNAQELQRFFDSKKDYSRSIVHPFLGKAYRYLNRSAPKGLLTHDEGAVLYWWASFLPKDSNIMEVGTYGGKSTYFLANGAINTRSRVFSIDPFELDLERQILEQDDSKYEKGTLTFECVKKRLDKLGFNGTINLINGFSKDVSASWNLPINFLFIDGNHSQAGEDYLSFRKFLAPNSRVAFHDANPNYGRGSVPDEVIKIIESENVRDIEVIRSLVSFVLE